MSETSERGTSDRVVIVEQQVRKCDCPDGGWQPTVHARERNGRREIWAMSAWPDPFVSGPGPHPFDNVMLGTWICHPADGCVFAPPGFEIIAEKTECGEIVTMRLVRIKQEQ
jgi:hypothetical protein